MKHQTLTQHVKDHLWGPAGSVLLHLVVVYLLVTFVQIVREPPDVPTGTILLPAPTPEPPQDPPPIFDPDPEWEDLDDVDITMKHRPEFDVDSKKDMKRLSEKQMSESTDNIYFPDSIVTIDCNLPNARGDRIGSLNRDGPNGGSSTEPNVRRALEWLKANQQEDGSWGRPGLTGLGLLTFLAHAETPASVEYGPTVERAIRHLMAIQQPDGRFSVGKDHAMVYDHAIAAYAISDAYFMTRIPQLRAVMERAVQPIIDGQQAHGGWDYGYKKNAGRNDLSVNGWQIQALKSAHLAGAKCNGLQEALGRVPSGVLANHDADSGGFGYTRPSANRPGTTAAGVLSLQLTGYAKSRPVVDGLRLLDRGGCDWGAAVKSEENWAMYTWYYATQAMFHQQGPSWQRWNPRMVSSLVRSQSKDGHWDAPAASEQKQGAVYSTTLAALTLQVYYRISPLTTAEAVKPSDKKDAYNTQTDDIPIGTG